MPSSQALSSTHPSYSQGPLSVSLAFSRTQDYIVKQVQTVKTKIAYPYFNASYY